MKIFYGEEDNELYIKLVSGEYPYPMKSRQLSNLIRIDYKNNKICGIDILNVKKRPRIKID